ncbi:MAG: DUF89 family protein [archaeon]|nr:DUF89 family protein [archaeon]
MQKNFDKDPYKMSSSCIGCILDVTYNFISDGLQIENLKGKIKKIGKNIIYEQEKEKLEILESSLEKLNLQLDEKKKKEWESVKKILRFTSDMVEETSFAVIIASDVFNKVKELTQNPDPWLNLKAMSTLICLNVEYDVRDYIYSIEDPKEKLRNALIFCALANTLDFGTAMHDVDLNFNFDYLLEKVKKFENSGYAINDFDILYNRLTTLFKKNIELSGGLEEIDEDIDDEISLNYDEIDTGEIIESGDSEDKIEIHENEAVVILLDNAGEIVFDKILIEILVEMGIPVIGVVKGEPISNDATMEDAEEIGLTDICPIISTGSYDLGFNPNHASQEFLNVIESAPIIIAKGQANFESINVFREYILNPEIFLIAKFKCNINANIAGVNVGDFVLWKMQ